MVRYKQNTRQKAAVQDFVKQTSATETIAKTHLRNNNWNLDRAVASFNS